MNRLCQSSYGNLEAVINIANHNGDENRKLVHFCRERKTGVWFSCAAVSHSPISGGSMLQSSAKRHENQEHSDFEVLVVEGKGKVQHYTRNNLIPVDNGVYAWELSATVNSYPCIQRDAIDAAPLIQSQAGANRETDGYFLETMIRDSSNRVTHFRCTLRKDAGVGPNQKNLYEWKTGNDLSVEATGPPCLYYNQGKLNSLIPCGTKIKTYIFKPDSECWVATRAIQNMLGPCCVYPNPEIQAIVRAGTTVEQFTWETDPMMEWKPSKRRLPASLSLIRRGAQHEVLPTNPIAITSRPIGSPPESHLSPNTEAIVFHAYGPGWQDSWMILHWSLLAISNQWVVSGIVLPHVIGMPL